MHALDRPPDDTIAPSSFSPRGVVKIVLVLQPYYNILLVILPIVLLVLLPLNDGRC